jgi:hypothetical protein
MRLYHQCCQHTTTINTTSSTSPHHYHHRYINNNNHHSHAHCHINECHCLPQMHQAQTKQGVVWVLGNFLFLFILFLFISTNYGFLASTYVIYHEMRRGMAGTSIGNENRAQETSMMSLGL